MIGWPRFGGREKESSSDHVIGMRVCEADVDGSDWSSDP